MLNKLSKMNPKSIKDSHYKWWAYAAIAIGTFTSVSDNGSASIALPSIASHFDTDLSTAQWIVTGYLLIIASMLLPMGRLADIIGRNPVYLSGFLIMAISAIAAGFSQNVETLIIARTIQGFGAAMTQGTSMAMNISAFTQNQRGQIIGIHVSVVGAGAVAGPPIGGLILGILGWQSVFWVTGILAFSGFLAASIILDKRSEGQKSQNQTFDWIGASLSTLGLVLFLLTISYAPRVGWTSPLILAAFPIVIVIIGIFIRWELRTQSPLLDVRMFQNKIFSVGIACKFILFIGMSGIRFLMPIFLQGIVGMSPAKMSLIFIPGALMMVSGSTISGKLSDKYGWKRLSILGLCFNIFGLSMLAFVTMNTSYWYVLFAIFTQSIGHTLFGPPNDSAILGETPNEKQASVASLINLTRNAANVVGIGVATAVVVAVMSYNGQQSEMRSVVESGNINIQQAFVAGVQSTYFIASGLGIIAMAFTIFKASNSNTHTN